MSTQLVLTEHHGTTRLLRLNRPPVNAFSRALRTELQAALAEANADSTVQAIILTGQGRGFSAGGDLKEFGTPAVLQAPSLSNDLFPQIEASRVPVIAALHGFAIGGGFELALACHHRIAAAETHVALPEVLRGVLPPSGSQRLPRAMAMPRAIALMASGETVAAGLLTDAPLLFDRVAEGDAVAEALRFAYTLDRSRPVAERLLRHQPLNSPDPQATLAAWRAQLDAEPDRGRALQGRFAAVEAAVQAPDFDAGLARAKQLHDQMQRDLMTTSRGTAAPPTR